MGLSPTSRMWCLTNCLVPRKSWTRLTKRNHQTSTQTQSEFKFDDELKPFSYASVPLNVRHSDEYHKSSYSTKDNTSDKKARRQTIRLIRILQSRADGLLNCHIRTAEINHHTRLGGFDHSVISYDALSYTWELTSSQDETSKQHVIVCNGRQLLVKENLYNCLTQLEADQRYHDRDLWIDAICINQEDSLERCQQVNIMADIYSSAERVTIWLGPADEFTKLAWELMDALGQLSNEDLSKLRPYEINNKHDIGLLGYANSSAHWEALRSLFERRWFGRAWVVQEVVLARITIVLCGDYTFDWDSMVRVSKLIAERSPANANNANSHSFKKPAKLAAIKEDFRKKKGTILLHSLIRCRTYDAKDDHDKVYSLLGLAKYPGGSYPDCLSPDYKVKVPKLFTDIAAYIMDSSNDLHVLAHAEGDMFRNIRELPTWVPDWSMKKDVGLRITGYERYSAAGELECLKRIDGNSLILSGFQLDTITRVGETKEEVNQTKTCPGWLDLLGELEEEYPERDNRDAFWRAILIDTDPSGTVPIKRPWENSFYVWLNMCDHIPSEDKKQRAAEFETSFTHSLNLRLFRTSRGHLGCGSLSCKEGDLVWIVRGSRVPLMLRPTQEAGVYNLVGGTYLHGFMQGEALSGDPGFKEVTLV